MARKNSEILLLVLNYLNKHGKNAAEDADITYEDVNMAYDYFKNSVDEGNGEALYIISKIYEKGIAVKKDKEKSLALLKQSADLGCTRAEAYLGSLYLFGMDIPQDKEKGYELIYKAAQKGSAMAEYFWGFKFVKTDINETLIWLNKAIEHGFKLAKLELALLYINGRGVEQDVEKGVKMLDDLSKEGYNSAKCELARLYADGRFIDKNVDLAAKLYLDAAESGSKYAMSGLIRLIIDKKVEGFDEYDLFYWTTKNHRSDSRKAKWEELNATLPDDFRKNIKDVIELEVEAEDGNVESMATLGFCYERGYYTKKNAEKAKEWYTKAAENGHLGAKSRLE